MIEKGHFLDAEDLILRKHILRLMCQFQTSWHKPDERTPFLEETQKKLKAFVEDGLVALKAEEVKITELGKPFLRNICMAFDARLGRRTDGGNRFSRTV